MNNCSAVKYRQIEERAAEVAHYIVDNNATVRQAAKAFGISKSTIHMVVTKWNGLKARLCGQLNKDNCIEAFLVRRLFLFTLFAENFTKNIARRMCLGYTNVR